MEKNETVLKVLRGLKLAGKTFWYATLGLSMPLAIVTGSVTTAVAAENAGNQAEEVFASTGEIDAMQIARQARLDVLEASNNFMQQKYEKGEISAKEYDEFKKEYNDEMNKSDEVVMAEMMKFSSNPEVQDLMGKNNILNAFSGAITSLVFFYAIYVFFTGAPLERWGFENAKEAIDDIRDID